eukprot:gene1138-10652_t
MGRRKKPEVDSEQETIIMRPRRIDLEKQIPILRPKDLNSILSLKRRITTSNYDRLLNSFETISKDDLKFLNETEIIKPDRVPIPEVKITEIENNSNQEEEEDFRFTNRYIRANDLELDPAEIALEYDMDEEDEKWLEKYNFSKVNPLDEVNFERIFALIERETQAKRGHCSIFGISNLSQKFLFNEPLQENDIYSVIQYWMNKNKQKYEQLQLEESKILILQKDILTMKKIRQDFEKVRVLIDLVCKRERLKKKLIKTSSVITDKNNIINEQSTQENTKSSSPKQSSKESLIKKNSKIQSPTPVMKRKGRGRPPKIKVDDVIVVVNQKKSKRKKKL